jgi:PTH1 family peptidyl-tRNA hydrolase
MAIETIARAHGFPTGRSKYQALCSEGVIGAQRVILMQPQTYMNDSGRAVAEAARFHKIALDEIVVFHDELDLPPSKLRVKKGGGNAGHNGLRSITAHMGNEYRRVRLGIGHPGDKALVHSFVLNDFGKSEMQWVDTLCDAIAKHAPLLVQNDDAAFQNRIHLAMDAAGFKDVKLPGAKD